jgi:hypothetical protein
LTEWAPRQRPVVVLRLAGDFDPKPGRPVEGFVFVVKLDLGDDEPVIVSGEHIDFPAVFAPGHDEACLFDQAAMAQRQERFGIEH